MTPPVDIEALVQNTAANDKPELRLWLRMLSTTNLIENDIRRRLRASFGMTLPQFDLLAQLYKEKDGLRLGELSKRLMVTNGNVTGLVDRLANEGMIEREVSENDRRVAVARLTKNGRDSFAKMAEAHEVWLKELFSACSPDDIVALRGDVKKLKLSVLARSTAE